MSPLRIQIQPLLLKTHQPYSYVTARNHFLFIFTYEYVRKLFVINLSIPPCWSRLIAFKWNREKREEKEAQKETKGTIKRGKIDMMSLFLIIWRSASSIVRLLHLNPIFLCSLLHFNVLNKPPHDCNFPTQSKKIESTIKKFMNRKEPSAKYNLKNRQNMSFSHGTKFKAIHFNDADLLIYFTNQPLNLLTK